MKKIIDKILLVLLAALAVSCEVEIDFDFDKNTFDEQKALWNEDADYINYSYIYIASKPDKDGADEICEKYEVLVNGGVASYIDLLSGNYEEKTDNSARFKIESIYNKTENFYYEHKDKSLSMCEIECVPDYSWFIGIEVKYDYEHHIPTSILYSRASSDESFVPDDAILFKIENFQVFN